MLDFKVTVLYVRAQGSAEDEITTSGGVRTRGGIWGFDTWGREGSTDDAFSRTFLVLLPQTKCLQSVRTLSLKSASGSARRRRRRRRRFRSIVYGFSRPELKRREFSFRCYSFIVFFFFFFGKWGWQQRFYHIDVQSIWRRKGEKKGGVMGTKRTGVYACVLSHAVMHKSYQYSMLGLGRKVVMQFLIFT